MTRSAAAFLIAWLSVGCATSGDDPSARVCFDNAVVTQQEGGVILSVDDPKTGGTFEEAYDGGAFNVSADELPTSEKRANCYFDGNDCQMCCCWGSQNECGVTHDYVCVDSCYQSHCCHI